MVRLAVSGDILEVELDPKKFGEPVIQALLTETVRRIGAISKAAKPSTVKRRGPGKLFNVTGRLRLGIAKEFLRSWRLVLPADRALPRPIMNRLRAAAKISLQTLLRQPPVQKALEVDIWKAVVRVVRKPV